MQTATAVMARPVRLVIALETITEQKLSLSGSIDGD
jgi:hypothetical protein